MLLQVIAHARRRLLWNELALQFAIAVAISLAALVLLLLLGTDAVAWSWLIILPAVSFGAGVSTVLWRRPGTGRIAQLLDRRLNQPDTLAAAVHFAQTTRRCDEEFRRALQAQATRIAESADLRSVIPFRMPRAAYFSAVLAMAATGLFFIRYGTEARLDLRAPMATILQQLLENARAEVAKMIEEFRQPNAPDRPQGKLTANREENPDGQDADAKPSGTNESNATGNGQQGQPEQAEEKAKADTFAGEQEQSGDGNPSSADARSGASENPSPSQQANQGNSQQQDGLRSQQSASSTSAGTSMVNKIKDSMANLLSALNPQQGGANGQQGKAQDGRQAGRNSKRGSADSGATSGESGQGDSPQKASAPPGGAGQGDMSASDKLQGNGAGRDDGSKEIRSAAQLEAMGKLGAIFGKRAEEVSGEFTVQAASGPQSLRTQYAQRNSEHSSVETVAMRDEVPVAYQEYIRHYYDLVRQANATSRSGEGPLASSRRPRAVR
jgi:hypothetical protein